MTHRPPCSVDRHSRGPATQGLLRVGRRTSDSPHKRRLQYTILGGLLHRTFPSRARLDDETDPAVALVEDVCVAPGGVSTARPRTSAPASERDCGLSPRRTSPPDSQRAFREPMLDASAVVPSS